MVDSTGLFFQSFRTLIKSGAVGISYSNLSGVILNANQSFLKLFGYTKLEVKSGKISWQMLTPDEYLPLPGAIEDLKKNGNSPVLPKEYLRKDGSRVSALIISAVLNHPKAEVINFLFDISDTKLLQEHLAVMNKNYQSIWNSGIVGINFWNTEGYILDCNDAYTDMLGYTKEEIKRGEVKWSDMVDPAINKYKAGIEAARSGRSVKPYETRHRHKDGGYRDLMIMYTMLYGSKNEGISLVIDITDKKQAEMRLERTTERMRKITEHMEDIVTIHGRDFRFVYASPAVTTVTNLALSDIIGKTTWEMGTDPAICAYFDKCLSKVFLEKTGTIAEYKNIDGRHFQSVLTPEFDLNGEVENVLVVTRDITEMKQQIQQRENFVSMVSHELKSPMTSLKVYLQMTERSILKGDLEGAKNFIEKANAHANRQVGLINHLLEVARNDSGKITLNFTEFNIAQLVNECVEITSLQYNHNHITVNPYSDFIVKADYERLMQVIVNLLSNASRYSSRGSEIIISLSSYQDRFLVKVKDSGQGIPEDKLPFIFDRFYRATEDGHSSSGLGLGLYISAQIVEKHHGQIWAESIPEVGSEFFVELPLNGDIDRIKY
jgi:two-component system CheB/CheR fusion protein